MPYQNIVFMQGDEAAEVIDAMMQSGHMRAIEHLLQWDMNGDVEPLEEKQPWGESDKLFLHNDLVLAWNPHIPYVSLTRIVL